MNSLTLSLFPTLPVSHLGRWLLAIVSSQYHKSKEEIEFEILQITRSQEDPREFGPIYDKYYDEIFIYISKRVEDMDMVADITSKTFTKCLTNIHKFRYIGVPFSAWLYKIAINEVRQFFRSRKNYPRTICITETELSDITEETIDETKHEQSRELLTKLLGSLKEKDLQCVELRFFEKKSFKEIGFIMGLTEVNAKIRTYRILKKLRKRAISI